MYKSEGIEKLAPGVFEINEGGTARYRVKFYRNTGRWGGFIAETDDRKQVHVPRGHVDEFAQNLVDATRRQIDVHINGERGTRVTGESSGVRLNDTDVDTKISDDEALRLAAEADKYIRNRGA